MEYWHWIAIGFGLMAFEMLLPSFFFLWLGAAALLVGAIMFFVPDLLWSYQWTLFAVIGIGCFFISRFVLKNKQIGGTAASLLNKRGAMLVGNVVVIETAIENGRGKAKVGDSIWTVTGPDLPVGASAKVVKANGTELKVEKV